MSLRILKATLLGLMFCGASFVVNAGVITVGSLTLENEGDIYVTDSLNGFDWLRWDLVGGLSFNDLLAAIDIDGDYEGWSIATTAESLLFHNALLGEDFSDPVCVGKTISNCSTHGTLFDVSSNGLNFVELMGKSTELSTQRTAARFLIDDNHYSWLSVNFNAPHWRYSNVFHKSEESSRAAGYDLAKYDVGAAAGGSGFMLYRESVAVPEPSTLVILGLSVICMVARRFTNLA